MLVLRSWLPRIVLVLVGLLVVALVVLTATGAFAGSSARTPAAGARGAGRSGRGPTYYVSLGDSYAVGYQPSPQPGATAGYTAAVSKATRMTLVNFGCGGATTTSILQTVGCTSPYGPPAAADAVPYPGETQAAAAVAFIRRHRGSIGLVTVSIGGNDITHCATASDPVTCVTAAVPVVQRDVTTLAKELRKAAGPKVPIIGITYPDVLLGLWVYPAGQPDTAVAQLSVTGFKALFNPALAKAYSSAGARLVDITADADGYVPLSKTTTLAPYGTIPVAVARVCELTWYCKLGNIHPNSAGYSFIGDKILAEYRALER